jgi:hypothetical protein
VCKGKKEKLLLAHQLSSSDLRIRKKLSNQLTLNYFEKVKGQETYRNRRQTIGTISKNTSCEASCERK